MTDRSHIAQHAVSQRQLVVLLGHIHRDIEVRTIIGMLMIMARLLLIAGVLLAHCMRVGDRAESGGCQE